MSRSVAVLLLGLWLAPALGAGDLGAGDLESSDAAGPALQPVPRPDLEAVEASVARTLDERHDTLDAHLADARGAQGVDRLALAQAYAELGLFYHAHAFLDSARPAYRSAASLVPDDPRWPHALGLLELDGGDPEAAAQAFEAALRLDASNPATRIGLAEIRIEQGRLDEADALLRAVLELHPAEPSALAARGRLALERRDWRLAVESLDAALALVPEAERLHYSLALAHRGLGDLDAARRHLEMRGSVGVRPADPVRAAIAERQGGARAMILRGRRAFGNQRWAEAAAAFARAVEADPESVAARVNLGAALVATGDLDGAGEALRAALALDPENGETHYNLGRVALLRGRGDDAVEAFTRALAIDPDDVESRRQLAVALQVAGQPERAIDELARVLADSPLDEDAHLARAQLLVDRERLDEALDALRAARRALPRSERIADGLERLESALLVRQSP